MDLWNMMLICAMALLLLIQFVFAGCHYDEAASSYTCGQYGECRESKVSRYLTLRYCVCKRGYSGREICTPCEDCCEDMAMECSNKRYGRFCKLPKCLKKVLKSRRCPKSSSSRKDISDRMSMYLAFCHKSLISD